MIAEILTECSLAALMMTFAVIGGVWYGLIELVACGRIESEASATLAALMTFATLATPVCLMS